MIISNKQVQNILQLERLNSLKKKTALKESAASGKNDSLVLSGQAQVLNFAKEQVLKSPEVRADKILELKKQIELGNYQVSGNDIASKIIGRSLVDELTGR
ncbi:MAG: flagellar biosynthesis anti-sigma factor FlgM [Firmicutes bacterium]|nr:flagellar biosynthesis anti-sigma factor FlgM [Bacillota bacterium]